MGLLCLSFPRPHDIGSFGNGEAMQITLDLTTRGWGYLGRDGRDGACFIDMPLPSVVCV
jgi:hypothetical protein